MGVNSFETHLAGFGQQPGGAERETEHGYSHKELSSSITSLHLREKCEPQAGVASGLSNSASKAADASGDGVSVPEPNTETPVHGEGVEGLPGSKSVARAEADARNRGGPESPCRTNYEG